MKEVCGALSHKTDELILREHQVDGNQLLIYIYIHVIYFDEYDDLIYRFIVTMYLILLI